MSEIPWSERVVMISYMPEAAGRDDVLRLASELMECRHELERLRDVVGDVDAEIIDGVLGDHNAAAHRP